MTFRLKIATILTLMACVIPALTAEAQEKNEFNPIQTGVTSLGIAPDARGASLGDQGVSTIPTPTRSSGIRRSTRLPTAPPECRSAIPLGCAR